MLRQGVEDALVLHCECSFWSDACAELSFLPIEGIRRDAAVRKGSLSFSVFKLPSLSNCACSFKVLLIS